MAKRMLVRTIGICSALFALYYLLFIDRETVVFLNSIYPYYRKRVLIQEIIAALFIISVLVITAYELSFKGKVTATFQRGRELIPFREAEKKAAKITKKHDPGILFGLLKLPSSIATSHFAFVGSTGSGKTISIRLLMQSILKRIDTEEDQRAIILDAKQEMLPLLKGMGLSCPIITISPLDERCYGWDMAKDITTPATAQQVASILAPTNKNSAQPYFSLTVEHLLSGVMTSFIQHSPGKWTFEDVVLAMRSPESMEAILSRSIDTADRLDYFKNEESFTNVMGTIRNTMKNFEVVAARWSRAKKKISLTEWSKSNSILILGNDEALRNALDPINKVIFKRLSELLLAQQGSETRRTWVILDELREAGKFEGLTSLLNKGRSNGVCVVIGFQDIEGLRSLYTREGAHEILSQCANKAILRIDSSETAEWAGKLFGEKEVLEEKRGISRDGNAMPLSFGKQSKSLSYEITKRPVVVQSEFLNLPPTTRENGLSGYYLVPSVGAYAAKVSGKWIDKNLLPQDSKTLGVMPADDSDQFLRFWNENDYERLNLVTDVSESEKKESLVNDITKKKETEQK